MHLAIGIGLGAAVGYAAFAAFVVVCDRGPHRGGWINLNGILSFLVTFPIAWLALRAGHRLDHRRNLPMLLAIAGTALLVAILVALLAWPFCA
jgi:uncharacterized membrane protein YidH (DUF202 family)